MGRRIPEPTDSDLRTIERMASTGATLDDIAYCLDWSPSTLDRRKKKYPAVEHAYNKGRASARSQMSNRLWDIAMSDDDSGKPTKASIVATIFWLKCQANWKEDPETTVDAAPQVQIYLPKRGDKVN